MFFLPTKINLGTIKINQSDVGSTFSIGQAYLVSRKNSNKKTQGFGQQMADFSTISLPIQFINDNDFFDSCSYSTKASQSE